MRARIAKRIKFSAVVTRANGEVDDYGTVMDTRWGPFGRWLAARRIKRLNRRRGL